MPFAAASSSHPVPAFAVGELAGRIIEVGGTGPDVLVLLAAEPTIGTLEDVVRTLRELLRPVLLVGCTSPAVLGGDLAVWAGYGFDAHVVDEAAAPIRLGGRRVVVDDDLAPDAAIGIALDAPTDVVTVHGCRAIGATMLVTDVADDLVLELDGEPAHGRVQRELDALDDDDRGLVRGPLLLGDEDGVRRIRGADRASGALAVDGPLGDVVRLHVRDRSTVPATLHRRLHGRPVGGALVVGDADLLPAAAMLDEWTSAYAGAADPNASTLTVVTVRDPW